MPEQVKRKLKANDKQVDTAISAFVRAFERMGGAFSPRDLFRDFVEMAYFAYAKVSALAFDDQERADALEARYMQVVKRYPEREWDSTIRQFPRLVALAEEHCALDTDFLGMAAAEINALNAAAGQFFTPMSVARALAALTTSTDSMAQLVSEKGFVTVSDCACGSGNLLLGFAEHMQQAGYPIQQHLLAHGRDVSFTAYCMSFLQLNWTGVPALVEHGDSLRATGNEHAWTMGAVMFAHCNGHLDFSATTEPEKRRTVNQVMIGWGLLPPDLDDRTATMLHTLDGLLHRAASEDTERKQRGKIITFDQKRAFGRELLRQAVGSDSLAARMVDAADETVQALDAEIVDAAQQGARQLTLF